MSKKLLSLVFAIGMIANVYGQKSLEVKESSESIGGASNKVLTVQIFQGDDKHILKDWKSLMKKNKGKTSYKKNELFADNVLMKSVSLNTIDVWAKVVADGDAQKLIVAVDLGGAFLSSSAHPEQYMSFAAFLREFAVKTSKNAVDEEIKDSEKDHAALESEQEKLVKEDENLDKLIEKNEKAIEDAKAAIEQAKKDIEKNGKDQEKKKGEIKEHAIVLQALFKKKDAIK
ncbi:MAG: hypothetical protein HRT71_08945 [Flavobacteriales bacterium]|nr:hypothetical protein [Flavobacteriales bacterium]